MIENKENLEKTEIEDKNKEEKQEDKNNNENKEKESTEKIDEEDSAKNEAERKDNKDKNLEKHEQSKENSQNNNSTNPTKTNDDNVSPLDSLIISKVKSLKNSDNNKQLYLCDPQIQERGLLTYISYTLTGNLLPSSVLRRYTDFYNLREKLIERWPGVYIPYIPSKETLGTINYNNIYSRLKILNRFCSQLTKIQFLMNSEEVTLFLSNATDISAQLDKLPELSTEERINRYKHAFLPKNITDSNLLPIVTDDEFNQNRSMVSTSLENIKNFKEFVETTLNNKEKEIENYKCLIGVFRDYEKLSLIEYTNGDEAKMIFGNSKDQELKDKVDDLCTKLQNPYYEIIEGLENDENDLIGMKETFDSISVLKEELINLKIENAKLLDQIIDIKKDNPKEILEKSVKYQEMEKEKELRQIGIKCLDLVIKLATHYLINSYFNEFKSDIATNYYKHLYKFKELSSQNNQIIMSLWKEIANNKNIVKEK